MFNKSINLSTGGGSHYHSHNHNIKVEEKRAPTDKSVELLNEFQDKARDNLIGLGKSQLEPFNVEFKWWIHRDVSMFGSIGYAVEFNINGKPCTGKTTVDVFNKEVTPENHLDSIYKLAIDTLVRHTTKPTKIMDELYRSHINRY